MSQFQFMIKLKSPVSCSAAPFRCRDAGAKVQYEFILVQ